MPRLVKAFDVMAPPPGAEEVAAMRRAATAQRRVQAVGGLVVTAGLAGAGAYAVAVPLPVALGMLAVVMLGGVSVWMARKGRRGTDALTQLEDLDPFQHPDACLELAEICKADPLIRGYLRQIAARGRRPVVAEYIVARTWYGKGDPCNKLAAAQAACAYLGMPGVP